MCLPLLLEVLTCPFRFLQSRLCTIPFKYRCSLFLRSLHASVKPQFWNIYCSNVAYSLPNHVDLCPYYMSL